MLNVILPRGITGFNVPKSTLGSDLQIFRSDCWAIVAPLQGRVEDRPQVLPGSLTSFLTQVLVLPSGEVTALLNTVHPWVGFCRPLTPGECWLEFVDPGPVTALLEVPGRYRVLSAMEMEQPLTDPMCKELGHAERYQLKYWSKLATHGRLRVGDVVFNFWD